MAPAALPVAELPRVLPQVTALRAALAIAAALVTFQLATLSSYGLTCDSPSLFYAGDRLLYFFQHPSQPGALDLLADHEPPGFVKTFDRFPDQKDPVHYPVLPGFFAAFADDVLRVRLHWVTVPMDGHHIGLILLNGIALFLFGLYSCALLGRGAGIAATLILALFPCAFGHAVNNAKDWPCAQFYGLAVMAAGVGVIRERARHLLAAGVLLGVGLSCKMNAAFVMPTVVLWGPVAYAVLHHRRKPLTPGVVGGYLLAPYVAFLVFFLCWPWLYYGRIPEWWEHLSEYIHFMVNYGAGKRAGWTVYSLSCFFFMSPPAVLALAALYLGAGWRKSREALATWALLVLWCGLPILRIAAPNSNFYDGNRHFIEYVPALSAMGGAGAAMLWTWARQQLTLPRFATLLGGRPGLLLPLGVAFGFLVIAEPVAEYHPFEATYFNFLVGGLGGAQQRGLFAFGPPADIRVNGTEGDYWFTSSRIGARELRKIMKPGDRLSMCGPGRAHAEMNWIEQPLPHLYEAHEPEFPDVDYLYVSPRETLCWWRQVRKLESERPILKRVERGGGLVFEILGPKTGKKYEPTSKETWYERNVHPWDTEGVKWLAARKAAEAAGTQAP